MSSEYPTGISEAVNPAASQSVSIRGEGGKVAVFRPEETKAEIAKARGMMEYGRLNQDLAAIESGADHLIEVAANYVQWWDENVTPDHGAGRGNKKVADRGPFSAEQAEADKAISKQQVSRWRKKLKDTEGWRMGMVESVRKKWTGEKGQSDLRGASGTGENEWYTPPDYIEMARAVLGAIELDPATSEQANATVKAEQIFTLADDGLNQEWSGNVWMNPPYAQPYIQQFIEKLVAEYQAGRVTEAIALTHNYTDTKWFQHAAGACRAICFTRGRIGFLSPSGEKAAPTQGQAFFYFGDDPQRFAEQFNGVGFVVEVIA